MIKTEVFKSDKTKLTDKTVLATVANPAHIF